MGERIFQGNGLRPLSKGANCCAIPFYQLESKTFSTKIL